MSLMSIKNLITSDPYYQNLVKPRGFPTGNDVYVPPTTPNPTPEPGIPSIVNPYLPPPYIPPNQGGGEGDGNNTIDNYKDYGYTGLGSSDSTIGFNIDDIREGTIDDEDMPGIFEQLSNLNIQTPGKFALDLINKGITNVGDYFANRKEEKAIELQKQIDADNLAAAEKAAADKLAAEIKAQQDFNRARNTDNNMGGDNSNFGGDRGVGQDAGTAGGTGGRRGGAGKFRDGGIASMFTRRR